MASRPTTLPVEVRIVDQPQHDSTLIVGVYNTGVSKSKTYSHGVLIPKQEFYHRGLEGREKLTEEIADYVSERVSVHFDNGEVYNPSRHADYVEPYTSTMRQQSNSKQMEPRHEWNLFKNTDFQWLYQRVNEVIGWGK